MSTRSCIARPKGDGWEGRYHHSDGYPTGLGAELWGLVQVNGVEWARRVLIDEHPAGWSCIIGADWSLAPGYFDYIARANFAGLMGESPMGPRCYCHGDRSEPAGEYITSRDEEAGKTPLFIEWVYVLGNLGMAIYHNYPRPRRDGLADHRIPIPKYGWRYIETFTWTNPEPDWTAIEVAVSLAREAAHEEAT